jgi:hypothetical protein
MINATKIVTPKQRNREAASDQRRERVSGVQPIRVKYRFSAGFGSAPAEILLISGFSKNAFCSKNKTAFFYIRRLRHLLIRRIPARGLFPKGAVHEETL